MSIWLCVIQHVLYHNISSVYVHVYIFLAGDVWISL